MSHHAHDFFDLVAERTDGWSADELQAAVYQKFGDNPTFHTCSMQGLSYPQLLEFVLSRGKVSMVGERLFGGVHSCGH